MKFRRRLNGESRDLLFAITLFLAASPTCIAYNMPSFFHNRARNMNTQDYMNSLKGKGVIQAPIQSVWFPTCKQELDYFLYDAEDGGDLSSDHPGFQDHKYRERRRIIADQAFRYHHGQKLPVIDYTEDEFATWKLVYERLRVASKKHAVEEYNEIVSDMEKAFGYGSSKVPQLQEISDYLQDKTGYTLRPAPGLLPARGFLNGLAFRVFHSTQYLRHGSHPFYTPEPDIVHEYVGHAPLLADPDFADLSQEIGLASLGASDEDIRRLAACYWFSVEFGLCRRHPGGPVKAYGAGVLSSLDELLHACVLPTAGAAAAASHVVGEAWGDKVEDQTEAAAAAAAAAAGVPELREWRPAEAGEREYPITTLQPCYYVSESLDRAKALMRDYCRSLPRPFAAEVVGLGRGGGAAAGGNEGLVVTDRPVVRGPAPAPRRKSVIT